TRRSSIGEPTTFDRNRGPSSSAMIATGYGTASRKPGWYTRWNTTNEKTVPRPLASAHSHSSLRHSGQTLLGGNQYCRPAAQRCSRSSCRRHASQSGRDSSDGTGIGFAYVSLMAPSEPWQRGFGGVPQGSPSGSSHSWRP